MGGILSIIVLLVITARVSYDSGFSKQSIQQISNIASSSATLIASSSAIPSPTAEPMISCNNENCGPIVIPKSHCSNTEGFVCCFVQKKWVWYSSRSTCKADQQSEKK